MTKSRKQRDAAVARAEQDLARLTERADAMRSLLVRLLQDVVLAESRLKRSNTGQLLHANEHLVVTALAAQADAEATVQTMAEVSRAAELDSLTQLPNRVLFLDRLGTAIAAARRNGTRLALQFLDLDNFKPINDTFGHAVGDEVLKLVAQRLRASIREVDTVCRYGGDEFVILHTEVSRPSDAGLIATKVLEALGAPSQVGDHTLNLTASVGISIYPDDGEDADTLMRAADVAMYYAKRHRPEKGVRATFHGDVPAGERSLASPSITALGQNMADDDQTLFGQLRWRAQLRTANEQLVLAALSAQELLDAAERARRLQDEFMEAVAVELSDPLAPIRIATDVLGLARTNDALLPRVQESVMDQAQQMLQLVNRRLDGSGGDASTLGLERRRVDMVGLIGEAVEACRPFMAARGQKFDANRPTGALEVQGDPIQLTQIIRNLLDNASRYTPEGGEIALSVVTSGNNVLITVSDSGIGITAQALGAIFEPFERDIHATVFNKGGLGIGLTVVRALAQAHGGNVAASSAGRGLGSQFVVTLPLADPASLVGSERHGRGDPDSDA
jgi:diguanylate cyclase (GGDEF)-like protein